jgi:hypothetical protein
MPFTAPAQAGSRAKAAGQGVADSWQDFEMHASAALHSTESGASPWHALLCMFCSVRGCLP